MTETAAGPAELWRPAAGEALAATLSRTPLDREGQAAAAAETLRILGRCRPADWTAGGAEAELVVGAVQSGKTLSFTSLIAAARDNGFPLVVVLAGTKKNLRDQTYERLLRDLGMEGDGGLLPWNPKKGLAEADADDVATRLRQWTRSPRPAHVVTTVGVVLKNSSGLNGVRRFLDGIFARVGPVPVLFVDDEADQAGLNIAARAGDESSTYAAIRRMREAAPSHTYVLYTATPQAPLLISLEDTLSPRSVSVLTPGPAYVGGEELFETRVADFVRQIDDDSALDPNEVRPPISLERAFATFLLAMVVAQTRQAPRPLSMLVHPSSGRSLHTTYEHWIRALVDRVLVSLESGDAELVSQLRHEMFAEPYADLRRTGGVQVDGADIPLETLVSDLEPFMTELRVRVVNSDDGHEIAPGEWTRAPGWVVIGGNKLDRGFTIENLAVTYMPRGPGVRNADTVQQRGRFFGYKRPYIDLLRAWLHPDTLDVYVSYVAHEKAMREELLALDQAGTPLREWRRAILLERTLNPTRRAVIRLETRSHLLQTGWVLTQHRVFGSGTGPSEVGKELIQSWLEGADVDPRDHRPNAEITTRVSRVPWAEVVPVLADWRGVPEDKDRIYALLLAARQVEDADPEVDVIFMNGGQRRRRGPDEASRLALEAAGGDVSVVDDPDSLSITNLMQGPDPADGTVYPGDRQFASADVITVQIHDLELDVPRGPGVPATAVAIHLPESYAERVILQRDQPR